MLNEASSIEPLGEAVGCEVSVVQEASFCHHCQLYLHEMSPTHTTTPSINRKDVCLTASKHLSIPD